MIVKRIGRGIALVNALLIATHFSCAAACDISEQALYAAYRPFLQIAIDETTSVYKKTNNYSFNAASEDKFGIPRPTLYCAKSDGRIATVSSS